MDHLYPMEKYSNAVYALATGAGRVKERLLNAATASFTVMDWVPEFEWQGVSDDIRRLWQRMTAHKALGDEGDFAASVAAMTEDQAIDVARLFVEIQAKLEDYHYENRGGRGR